MSFTNDARPENRVAVTDVRALRALAHPLRLGILNHLMTFGQSTATECAEALGSTGSNCSYHLRSLARFGLVEQAESTDSRERPWRSVATGLDLGDLGHGLEGDQDDLAARSLAATLAERTIDDDAALARRYIAGFGALPTEWQESSGLSNYGLRATAEELAALRGAVDALIRPYIAMTRVDAPADAAVVHLAFDAFPHPDGAL
ncbi:winged helix-turn-helix domain-containing protein [Lacisediminihabitans changchengi]|uniref:Helix-turn-helix transcriptional regulator n=1 Tax=Lacisediminihabitans changchengi TaxID=2787634 RepID=A0A934SJT9_9MICO|nr:helix-turn-helix domain-containing protein [Lacisediminihabitans changchengi]MBK4346212.1 helix-turn-helix transcriptional regulator [Lacisediminihabitans changchengi]